MLLYLFKYALQILIYCTLIAAAATPTVPSIPTVGPTGTLVVANDVIAPDGFSRSAALINGIFPAPLIVANKGDSFSLNVVNRLTNDTMLRSTSVHWHGLLQQGTSWADGPVGVSQCPIAPNHSFLYQFNNNQAGTYWYHSHYAAQYCDGMRGALVVYDPEDPHKNLYDVDDASTVITLADWYHFPSPSLPDFPAPDSALINGKGRFPGGEAVALTVITVQHGKRYRLRIINTSCDSTFTSCDSTFTSCDSTFTFSIDNHLFNVIEADARSVVPVGGIDTVNVFPGQRHSLVISANQPVGNYWIRGLPDFDVGDPLGGFEGGINSAILRYVGAPDVDPTTTLTQNSVLDETQLHALVNPTAPGLPNTDGGDVNINLQLNFDDTSQLFMINGKTFEPPSVPVLLQILTGTPPTQLLPSGSVFVLPRNRSVSLSMSPGNFDGPHPFHLHGHAFSVVRSAGSSNYNYLNPVQRDTVSLGDVVNNDNVTIRFSTDNPGPWILHCHIQWHFNRGLAIVFAEDPGDIPSVVHPPTAWESLCPIFDNLPASLTTVQTVSVPTPSS